MIIKTEVAIHRSVCAIKQFHCRDKYRGDDIPRSMMPMKNRFRAIDRIHRIFGACSAWAFGFCV